MSAISPAVQIAIGVLNIAADAMTQAREAEKVIRSEGAGDLDAVALARRRLRAETILATDDFEAALDAADRAQLTNTDRADKE